MSVYYKSAPLILKEVSNLIQQYGQDTVTLGSKFRPERELYIGSIFSLGISSVKGIYSWLRKSDEDPPDVELTYIEYTTQGNIRHYAELEIAEFQRFSRDSLLEILKSKATRSYPSSYILLLYVWGRRDIIFPEELYNELKHISPKLTAIFIMANIDNKRNVALIEIYPGFQRVDFNFVSVANSWPSDLPHKTNFTRGR